MNATMGMEYQKPFNLKPILIIILAIGIAFAIGFLGSHGVDRHKEEAIETRNCLNNNGPNMVFQKIHNANRFLRICEIGENLWGIQVVDRIGKEFHEKTAFFREGDFESVVHYAKSSKTKVFWEMGDQIPVEFLDLFY